MELAQSAAPKSTASGRVLQSLTWPLNSAVIKEKLTRLERLKTWFLLAFALEPRTDSQRLADQMQDLLRLVQEQWIDAHKSQQQMELDGKLLALIAPESPYSAHESNCRPWHGTTTGSWFVQGELKSWLEDPGSDERLMVLTGRSGSGKSTLMSRAIEESRPFAENHQDVHVAYFYCAYNNISSRQTRNVLGSLVAQLAARKPGMLDRLPKNAQRPTNITINQLEDCLTNTTSKERLLLLIDAINGSEDGEELLRSVEQILSNSTQIQMIVSTTPYYQGIHDTLKTATNTVTMLPHRIKQDTTIYINDQIEKHRVLSRVPAEEIVDALLPRSEGMFRWVDCQMSFLTSQLTPNAVRKALRALPGCLDSTYELMLERVPNPCQNLVREILTWLSFCQRPLHLDEICEAAVFEECQTNIDEDDRIDNAEDLLAMCRGLAELDPVSGAVTLAHSSVKAFLTGNFIRSSRAAYFALDEDGCARQLVRKCLAYLMMNCFKPSDAIANQGSAERRDRLDEMMVKYVLLDYVCLHWATHARSCKLQRSELDLIELFFKTQQLPGGGNFAFWISCLSSNEPIGDLHETQPLYYAASYGLTTVVKFLLESGLVSRKEGGPGWYIDHLGGRNSSSALQVAVWKGHADIVDLLLDAGADPNSKAKWSGLTCMAAAHVHENYEIADRLLKAGAIPEYRGAAGRHSSRRWWSHARGGHGARKRTEMVLTAQTTGNGKAQLGEV